MVGRILDMNM